jgi:hypothetical protein
MLPLELLYGLGALLLFGALIYGFTQYKRRNRANDAITEAATREEYSHPDAYDGEEEDFRQQIRPS